MHQKLHISKWEKYLFYFTIIDLFFLPYVPIIATTFSQLFVFFWFVFKNKSCFNRKLVIYYYFISIFVIISNIFSFISIPKYYFDEYYVENFKIGISLIMSLTYYFFFDYFFRRTIINLTNWLLFFILYVVIWGLLYFFNMNLFISLKKIFNPYDAFTSDLFLNSGQFIRYNFIWTDPNNIGYALVGLTSYFILNKRINNILILICIISLLFILLIIMSGGSILTSLIIIPISLFYRFKTVNLFSKVLLSITLFVAFFLVSNVYINLANSEIAENSINRLENKTETEEPRFKIWERLFEDKNIIFHSFVGEGSNIFVKNRPFSPHNGHLMFIFGYGCICWIFYLKLIFWKTKSQLFLDYIFIIPFLICFTINIGIGELKYSALMYLMVVLSRIKQDTDKHYIYAK